MVHGRVTPHREASARWVPYASNRRDRSPSSIAEFLPRAGIEIPDAEVESDALRIIGTKGDQTIRDVTRLEAREG